MVSRGSERYFDIFIYVLLLLLAFVCIFPLLFVLSVSVTPYSEVLRNGGFILIPKSITFEAYKILFGMKEIPRAFLVTIFVTVMSTAINLILTIPLAFALSRKHLIGRGFFIFMIVFTMMFGGGLIPTYLVVQATGLLNTVWAMIIPTAISTWNVLIVKTFFENLPEELFESARIDGAGEFKVLSSIALPLSIPVMVTIGLFCVVGSWNTFFAAIFYITDNDLNPLQVIVRRLLMSASELNTNATDITLPSTTLQMASVVIASLPVIIVYPFVQKHLTKGMLIGALKG
ncbi:carbohydrate ABC transporter permease [Paenibacillus pasadenensis]|uniref:carbohydrate ABC transporter permease n=1 Tax=Paenibacillus pasadenensis TaxID=217090 RepID=UPI00203C3118|nr:carbohydrate ABC transporter permease [Paenibacillus pasadenensis]MCM3748585.1 carbohydrate ABC transporter permease [Paenibacillus pasadenensis]